MTRVRIGDLEVTPAEARVVRLVAHGRSNAEIAAELHLSVRTVESHLAHVFATQGISRRTQLARRVFAVA